ncbi:MAG: hypothetical protein SV253_07790 [Halobacteria archaeon]|nr:hypothetical protein [Halobacteria archaeon]
MSSKYTRGDVVKGPDLFADNSYRPYVCVTDSSHPFNDEEGLFVAVTTTRRSVAIPLSKDDFEDGGLPRESYVNPWTVATINHSDIEKKEGSLIESSTERIAKESAGYLGVSVE